MIITQSLKDKKIYVGEIVVKDKYGLKEVRDFLMKYSNDKLETYKVIGICDDNGSCDLYSFRSLLNFGYLREGGALIHQYPVDDCLDDSTDECCAYRRDKIYSVFLNSILIFSSLLGDLDGSGFEPVVQSFIGTGIINCHSFEEVWPRCSRNLATKRDSQLSKYPDHARDFFRLMEEIRLNDLKAFRTVLKEGLIHYQIDRAIPKEVYTDHKTFSGITCLDLEQIMCNNELILGEKGRTKSRGIM